MMIDEADIILSCQRLNSSIGCGASDEDIDKALGVAIETMRKYQNIREIVKKWELDSWTDNLSYESMIQIREVLEHGNDNNKEE